MRIALALTIATLLALTAPVAASADRLVIPAGPTFVSTGNETVAFGGFVYFAANDGVHGNELWRTDGTEAGTTTFDINAGNASSSSNPRNFTVVGNRLFFAASTPTFSIGIYTIDGSGSPQPATIAGTTAQGSLVGVVGGKVLLVAYEQAIGGNALYSLGETGSAFTKISSGNNNVSDGRDTATVGGWAYYAQATGPNSAAEPWRTNGVTTQPVAEIMPGLTGSQPSDFFATGNRAYFVADDGVHGRELWVTNPADNSVQLVHEHHALSVSTSFYGQTASGNILYYVPNDPTTGGELWRTDGTDAGTRVVKDITPGIGGSGQIKLFPFGAAPGIGVLYGSDLYASDGTDAGTTLLGSVDGDGLGPAFPRTVGSRAYFRGGFDRYGSVLWRTDGTPAGTFALTAGAFDGATPGNPDAGPPTELGSKVIFTGLYPHAAGDSVPVSARKIYVLDTVQVDETRRATVAPSISGTPAVGQKLTGSDGTWTLEPNRYTRQWLRNGTPIPNATAADYTPSAADAGAQLSFRVTASGIGGPNVVATDSAAVTVGGAAVPAGGGGAPASGGGSTSPPVTVPKLTVKTKAKLTGTARVGKKITLKLPTFDQSGVTLSFSWYASGKFINKQTRPSLKLTSALKGKRIKVTVTVTKQGFETLTLTATLSGKVKAR